MLIRRSEQVTPDWLTKILYNKGVLQMGKVISVEVVNSSVNQGSVATVSSLAITYSDDVNGCLPERLCIKISKPDLPHEVLAFGSREVAFYRAMTDIHEPFSIPRCYDAVYDTKTNHSHILMEDLSVTHFQKPSIIPPSIGHCELLVESLGQLHACWWNGPRLGVEIGEPFDQSIADATRHRLENTFPEFMDFFGDSLVLEQRKGYESVLSSTFFTASRRTT